MKLEMLRNYMPIITLIGLIFLVGTVTPEFLTIKTLLVLASDTATLFVMAMGVTFLIMLGGIDLSIQSIASFSSVVVALSLPYIGYFSFVIACAFEIINATPDAIPPIASVAINEGIFNLTCIVPDKIPTKKHKTTATTKLK